MKCVSVFSCKILLGSSDFVDGSVFHWSVMLMLICGFIWINECIEFRHKFVFSFDCFSALQPSQVRTLNTGASHGAISSLLFFLCEPMSLKQHFTSLRVKHSFRLKCKLEKISSALNSVFEAVTTSWRAELLHSETSPQKRLNWSIHEFRILSVAAAVTLSAQTVDLWTQHHWLLHNGSIHQYTDGVCYTTWTELWQEEKGSGSRWHDVEIFN